MISRRHFLGCSLCAISPSAFAQRQPRPKRLILCASSADVADVEFHPLHEVDWSSFYIGEVPNLIEGCFEAFGVRQLVAFSDEVPLQASFNDIDFDTPSSSMINVGVGNLALYSYATILAVILHELGHYYCCRSKHWDAIESNSVQKQIELLADYVAGAAYARMEASTLRVSERVQGQCSELGVRRAETQPGARGNRERPQRKVRLSPGRLARADKQAEFFVLRGWRVEPLPNNALIGPMPNEDPLARTCTTTHVRTMDFLAIAASVSSWRTFGDRPTTESHGTPPERYDSFSLGYETAVAHGVRDPMLLSSSLLQGMKYLAIGA